MAVLFAGSGSATPLVTVTVLSTRPAASALTRMAIVALAEVKMVPRSHVIVVVASQVP
jgi:hypothetical protein